ncbi:iron ABC transporter permease [Brucella sp. TWI559]
MMRRYLFLLLSLVALLLSFYAALATGDKYAAPQEILAALKQAAPTNYEEAVIVHQRLPRSLIAVYVGALMACSGLVFQGLIRNPLASSSTMGVNAGATMFVIVGAIYFKLTLEQQGLAALLGGFTGFAACLTVSRLAGGSAAPRGLMLILSGTLIAMLFSGVSNAVLLGHPTLRMDYLPWLTGNINHAYSERLYSYGWIGIAVLLVLLALARPLTLILLGEDKARSAGVNAPVVSGIGLFCAIIGASSAVAICGPIGFVGLVVPHIVRPFTGQHFIYALPACAMIGAVITLIADIGARIAFLPYVVHTGVIMDLLGGLAFIWVIRRYYLSVSALRLS